MKTDLVLTMGEYLAMCGDVTKHVNPPAKDARHIPVIAAVKPRNEAHGCRCDRWGHPCPGCIDDKRQRATVSGFGNKEKEVKKWNT